MRQQHTASTIQFALVAHATQFALVLILAFTPAAHSYPQFQMYVEKHSHRATNCAMCHVNDNGPMGDDHGQLGSLTRKELDRLQIARSAMAPGQEVDSPILNEFGNHIIKTIGRAKFLQLIADPAQLAPALGNKSDLDGDGIPDSEEYLDGTHPLNKYSGDPGKLLLINLGRNWTDVLLAVCAVAATSYGLSNLLRALSLSTTPIQAFDDERH